MSRIYLKLAVLVLLITASCETYVSTKEIDSDVFTFMHAGKEISLPVELQEIRTSKRRGGLFEGRDITYKYAMVVLSEDHRELFQLPCQKSDDIEDFIEKFQVKRSKDRKHFALGVEDQTIAVYHLFNKQRFIGYAPLLNTESAATSFGSIDLNGMENPRTIILDHISGDRQLQSLDENKVVDLLCTVSPQDELNQEAIHMLTGNNTTLTNENAQRLIDHCKSSENWRKRALAELRENRESQDDQAYIYKLYALGGQEAVEKEDKKALAGFGSNGNPEYFVMRMKMSSPKLSNELKKQFKSKIEYSISNICQTSDKTREDVLVSIHLLEEMGDKNAFKNFVEKYDNSSCKASTIHDLNNTFLFISDITPNEKRIWIDFMLRNFASIPKKHKSSDYNRIESELTCPQKRDLLSKYKKEIDTFNDMEIPSCN